MEMNKSYERTQKKTQHNCDYICIDRKKKRGGGETTPAPFSRRGGGGGGPVPVAPLSLSCAGLSNALTGVKD